MQQGQKTHIWPCCIPPTILMLLGRYAVSVENLDFRHSHHTQPKPVKQVYLPKKVGEKAVQDNLTTPSEGPLLGQPTCIIVGWHWRVSKIEIFDTLTGHGPTSKKQSICLRGSMRVLKFGIFDTLMDPLNEIDCIRGGGSMGVLKIPNFDTPPP